MKTTSELKIIVNDLTKKMENLQNAEQLLRLQHKNMNDQYNDLLKQKNFCYAVYIAAGAKDLSSLEQEIYNICMLHTKCVHYLNETKSELEGFLRKLKSTEIMEMFITSNVEVVVQETPVYQEHTLVQYLVEGEDDDGFCLEVQVFA